MQTAHFRIQRVRYTNVYVCFQQWTINCHSCSLYLIAGPICIIFDLQRFTVLFYYYHYYYYYNYPPPLLPQCSSICRVDSEFQQDRIPSASSWLSRSSTELAPLFDSFPFGQLFPRSNPVAWSDTTLSFLVSWSVALATSILWRDHSHFASLFLSKSIARWQPYCM